MNCRFAVWWAFNTTASCVRMGLVNMPSSWFSRIVPALSGQQLARIMHEA